MSDLQEQRRKLKWRLKDEEKELRDLQAKLEVDKEVLEDLKQDKDKVA